jgi:hypothetical protein
MKIFAGVLACVFLVVIFRLYQHSRPTPKEAKTTDEFIQSLSSEAVKDADANHQIKLDYSVDSIKKTDQILGKLHESYETSQSSIALTGLSAEYGAYVGEVIRKTEPGAHWERERVSDEKMYSLKWNKVDVYPMNWCEKRIVDGDDDDVWMKYIAFKSMQKKDGS